MRGEAKRKMRLANLWRLRKRYTWELIAEKSDTNAQYLSQIANVVIQTRGKRPRRLTDAYAEKIEAGLNLEPGWFDRDHADDGVSESDAAAASPAEEAEWASLLHAIPPGDRPLWFALLHRYAGDDPPEPTHVEALPHAIRPIARKPRLPRPGRRRAES